MITSSELMTGNLFKLDGHFPSLDGKIISIKTIEINPVNSEYFVRVNENFNLIKVNWLQPIPLTPEILTEWCSFKHLGYKLFKGKIVLQLDSNGIFYDLHGNEKYIIVFKFLHELQNWYYWNSNKQHLTINIPK